jgi:hypothetical protein
MGDTLSKPVNGEEPKAKSERSQQLDKLGGTIVVAKGKDAQQMARVGHRLSATALLV